MEGLGKTHLQTPPPSPRECLGTTEGSGQCGEGLYFHSSAVKGWSLLPCPAWSPAGRSRMGVGGRRKMQRKAVPASCPSSPEFLFVCSVCCGNSTEPMEIFLEKNVYFKKVCAKIRSIIKKTILKCTYQNIKKIINIVIYIFLY